MEKLMGAKNYGNWEYTMRNILIREGLWDAVIDRDGKIDPAIVERALAIIGLSVQPRIFSLLRTCKTAYQAWNTLKSACETKSFIQEVMLLRKLIKTRYATSRNMSEYTSRILNIGQKLSAIDAELPDRLIAIILLMNLPESFDPLVIALTYRNKELTSEIICAALLQEESRRELNANEDEQNEASMIKKHKEQQNLSSNKTRSEEDFTIKFDRCRKEVSSIRSPSYPYLSSESNDETEKCTCSPDLSVKKKKRAVDESRSHNAGDQEIEKDTEENKAGTSRISKKRKRESKSLFMLKPIQPILQQSSSEKNELDTMEEDKLILLERKTNNLLEQKINNLTMKVDEMVKLQTEGNDLLEKILLYQQEQTARISVYEAKLQDLQDQGRQTEMQEEKIIQPHLANTKIAHYKYTK